MQIWNLFEADVALEFGFLIQSLEEAGAEGNEDAGEITEKTWVEW